MLKVIVSIHIELTAAYMSFLSPNMLCTLVEYPYKAPLQDFHVGRHSLHQIGVIANLNLLQEITKL